ncbi:MAG: response regulator, partial [Victivallaceae bacterium]
MDQKNSNLRILLIEDSDTDAFIIQKALRQYKPEAQCLRAPTLHAGEEILQQGAVDLILLDLGLPDTASPADTYEQIKKWAAQLPVVIMTNLQDHELARG